MRYRPYGKTDARVSEIGMGGHREGVDTRPGLERRARFFRSDAERARIVGAAVDAGVTYFDTTFGCELVSLGESLRILGKRDGLLVSGMRVDFFGNLLATKADPKAYTRREIEGRLREFGFDHIDQFMLGAMEAGDPLGHSPAMMEDAIDELHRQRDAGKIRHIGFSCHDPDYAGRLIRKFPIFDAVMTPYNYANRAAEGDLAEVLRDTGMAWIAMKTLVWHVYGIPVTALRNLRGTDRNPGFDPNAPIGKLAHKFVLSNPLVTTTVPAMNGTAAAAENAAAADGQPLTPEEEQCLREYADAMNAADRVPLAIAGLLEDNLRVRGYALEYCRHGLKLDVPPVDYEGDGAEVQCAAAARRALDILGADERGAGLVPAGI